MPAESLYLYGLIVGCEAAFWLVLLLALATRYVWRRERASRALLLALPVIDLLLLAFTAMDLKAGTPATLAHGLATAYVGFTIAFGSVAVRWADQRFHHRFAAGPVPDPPPIGWWPTVRYDLVLWLRCIVAWLITAAILVALIGYIDDEAITKPLLQWFRIAFGSIVLWFVFGPLWSVFFFRRAAS